MSEALETLHWQALKAKMEAAGLPWISKADAIEKLGKLEVAAGDGGDAGGEQTGDAAAPKADAKPAKPANGKPCFDRKRPYGDVMGRVEGAPGARYLQDRLYFNSAGEVVGKV